MLTKIIAAKRIKTALSRNVPSAADVVIKIGNGVFMYRENLLEGESDLTLSLILMEK